MAVRSAKCHFVSEQQLSVQLQEIDAVLIIVKKRDMLMLVTSIQTASPKCPPTDFYIPGTFCRMTVLLY